MARTKTPEEIRAERIANLTDPAARAEILKIQDEKAKRLAEVQAQWKAEYPKRLAELTDAKVRSRTAPSPAPQGLKPDPVLDKETRRRVEHEARADLARMEIRVLKLESEPFDRRTDRLLDAAERPRGGKYAELHNMHRNPPPDRSDR